MTPCVDIVMIGVAPTRWGPLLQSRTELHCFNLKSNNSYYCQLTHTMRFGMMFL